MKVLIATPYFAPRVGGLELYAEHIAVELSRLGWEVHILTSGDTDSTTTSGRLTIHRLHASATISNTPVSPAWTTQARRLIAELKPDVINVHAPVPSMALAVAAAAGRTPLVVTYHAGSMKKGSLAADTAIAAYEQVALPWLMRRATAVICASDFVRTRFLGQWSAKSTTITPGVDTDKFTPAFQRRVAGRVLFVGDFRDPRKGLTHLLDAISLLPNATLRVVGQGSGHARRGVQYTGVLDRPELTRELQSASLLVLPSTSEAESFGMVLIEAMACGLPVIGSDIGGIPGVINSGHDGLIVPPANPETLAKAIQQLLSNPYRAEQIGINGRLKAETQFSWTTRGIATDQVLKAAIKQEVRHG